MEVWPPSLPQDISIGAKRKHQSGMVKSATDAGPPKRRKRFTATIETIGFSMVVTGTQLGALTEFWKNTLNECVDAFTWTNGDPFRFTTSTGDSSYDDVNYRFVDPPTESLLVGSSDPAAAKYQVTINLERWLSDVST